MMWLMERREQSAVHKLEVNCAPLSEVMIAVTPKRCIQPVKRAAAQSAAAMLLNGIASGQCVVLSTTVNKYENPEDCGSGPTISTWICSNRRRGTAMVAGARCTWRDTLDR